MDIQKPPSTDFTQLFTNTLEFTDNCRIVFAGNFNIDVLNNSNTMRNYLDTFYQNALMNEINLPTFVSPSTRIDE